MAQTGVYPPPVGLYPNISVEEYLWQLNQGYAARVVPAIGLLAALMGLGVVGNCLVLWVYTCKFQRRTVTSFIQALAVFDLLSCCLAMPGEIFDMTNNYTFGRNPLCKIVRTVNLFCSMASGATLVVVAVDRYRRICLPFRPQISARGATTIIICCSFISLIVSLPALTLIGGQTVATDWVEVNGTDCSISDQYVGTVFPLIYNGVQLLLFLAGAVTLIVLYSLIGSRVYRHVNQRQARQQRRSMARSNFLMPSPSQCSSNSTHVHGEHHTASHSRRAENDPVQYSDNPRQQDITFKPMEVGANLGHPDAKLATKFYSVSKTVETRNTEDETTDTLNYNRSHAKRCNSDYTNRTYQTLFSFLFDKDGSPSSSMIEFQQSCTVAAERKVSSVKTEKSSSKRKQAEAKMSTATFLKTPEMKAKHANIMTHCPSNTAEVNGESNSKFNGTFGNNIALNTPPNFTRDNSSIAKSPISAADGIDLPPTVQAEGQIPVLIINNYSESDQTSTLIENGNKSLKREVGFSCPRLGSLEQESSGTKEGSCPPKNQVTQQNTYKRLRHSQDTGIRRATLMLFMITVVYVTSFLPHLVLMTLKALGLDPGDEPAWQLAHNLLIRSYFINSVANPVIYSFFSRNFFAQCQHSACRC